MLNVQISLAVNSHDGNEKKYKDDTESVQKINAFLPLFIFFYFWPFPHLMFLYEKFEVLNIKSITLLHYSLEQ